MAQCWMCRVAKATTGEHKWPAAYLRRIPEDWKNLQHGSWDGERFHTQGVGSKNLKHFVLCAHCNNAVSHTQDLALDAFLIYLDENERRAWYQRTVSLFHSPDFDPLDVYRALLKLEFSRLADEGMPVPVEIAKFVSGGNDWEAANRLVRITFRRTINLEDWGITYPSETCVFSFAEPLYFVHQINFGWFGVHYVFAPLKRPALPWGEWQFDRVGLVPCESAGGSVEPLS